MSIGNTISEGNKGINFPWQLKMLLGQQCACDQLTAIAGNTDQVEYLLTAILTSLQASTDYEAKFVLETCPGPPVTTRILLEVRIWDQDSQQWVGDPTYYLPGNATPTTIGVGCTIEYTDPSGVLALILGAIEAGNLILTDIETNTGDTVTELQSLLALYTAGQSACASSLSVTLCTEQGTSLSNIETNTTGLATETTLLSVDSSAAQLVTNTTSVLRTPSIDSVTGLGSTTAGVYSFSIANVGGADGLIDGVTIPAGMTVSFDGGALNNTLDSISFDATGTTFIITYIS
jgi:hypothetical protein